MTPRAVFWIWGATLVLVTFAVVPLAVYLLHRTLRAAMMIEEHVRESLEAGRKIAANTAAVAALDETIAAAASLLEATRALRQATRAIADGAAGRR